MENKSMPDNKASNDTEEILERKEVDADLDLEKTTIQHEFSNPWVESDLVLVIEDQKVHVHRLILKMASPVFKTMLSSDFKEKDANEITLPGKKVNEFVDLLRQIYPLLRIEITLNNIVYIYKLADEYQMKKVIDDCKLFLSSVKKTKDNAMDILLLAQDIGADEARQNCCDVLKKMTLTELESRGAFTDLDGQSMRELLLPFVKRLQQCVKEILPEFFGSIDGMMHLWCHEKNAYKMAGVPNGCPDHKIVSSYHYSPTRRSMGSKISERIRCDYCNAMLKEMAKNACDYESPSRTYLSENVLQVLDEMMNLIKME